MNYLMLVCSEDAPPPPDVGPIEEGAIEAWIALCGERRIYGEALADPDRARTLRIRDGETIITDGPFIEAKEFIAGFDLLSCADLDEAITLVAAHPVASRRMLELRPFSAEVSFTGVAETLFAAETRPGERFMMAVTLDGFPAGAEVEARLERDGRTWGEELSRAGQMLFAGSLQGPETATTVRVRSGGTLLSDGPFVETKEFLAGLCVLDFASIQEALDRVASFPLAAHHPVEVRPFFDWGP